MTLEEALYRAAAAGNRSLSHCTDHLIQRQVRLVRDQREQTVRVLLQRRRARAVRLRALPRVAKALYPFDRCTGADLELFRHLTPRSAALQRAQWRVRGYLQNMLSASFDPPNSNQCDRLAHPRAPWEIYRFNWAGTCELALVWLADVCRNLICQPRAKRGCGPEVSTMCPSAIFGPLSLTTLGVPVCSKVTAVTAAA